jgi:predicted GNAT superfamily acetyltransferase
VAEIAIRSLETPEDLRACEDLQMEVWGYTEREVVPKNELLAAVRSGGVLQGAWEGDLLIGFAYGMAGLDAKGPYLSSRLLAVKTGQRSQGLGERLKRAQRDRALALGYGRVRWTQDPLQAANARLNLRKLGALATSYVRDYYGSTSSPLHGGLPTDRLELVWQIASDRVRRRMGELEGVDPDRVAPRAEPVRILAATTGADGLERPGEPADPGDAATITIAAPSSFGAILERDRSLALAWREATRAAFERAFALGHVAHDFVTSSGESFYVLSRDVGGGA